MDKKAVSVLKKKKKTLLEEWMQFQLNDPTLREDLITNDDLRVQSSELLNEILDILETATPNSVADNEHEEVSSILAGISISRAKQGFSPRETGAYVFSLKDAFNKVLQDEYSNDPAYLYEQFLAINKLVDSLGIITFETFIKGREDVIRRQLDEISEISTPVIKVWDGILALPIIGTLDSARTQIVMESLLQEIVNTGSGIAILDISGVPAVDSLVAQHLIKAVSATRLMGAECIISGIRPEIAQTIVHLGIDLSSVITKASLESALKHAFSMLTMEVRKVSVKA